MESDLIRKKAFTSAQPHDSQLLDELLSADETTVLETVLTVIKKINKKHERMGFTTVFWIKEPENTNSETLDGFFVSTFVTYVSTFEIDLQF